MTNLRSGVDIIEIERVAAMLNRHGERFLERVFTPTEQQQCRGKPASFAARFAAKEAVSKALGCGIGAVGWKEIEIQRDQSGVPVLYLYGEAQRLSRQLGLQHWTVSISHSKENAIAFVIAFED